MENKKQIDIYNDGTDEFIKLKDLYQIVMCGANAVHEMVTEAKNGNLVELQPLIFNNLAEIGIKVIKKEINE